MKRILAVFGYFIMSAVLFFGGVTLNAAPPAGGDADIKVPAVDKSDPDVTDDGNDADILLFTAG